MPRWNGTVTHHIGRVVIYQYSIPELFVLYTLQFRTDGAVHLIRLFLGDIAAWCGGPPCKMPEPRTAILFPFSTMIRFTTWFVAQILMWPNSIIEVQITVSGQLVRHSDAAHNRRKKSKETFWGTSDNMCFFITRGLEARDQFIEVSFQLYSLSSSLYVPVRYF